MEEKTKNVVSQVLLASAGAFVGYFVTAASTWAEHKAEQARLQLRIQVMEERLTDHIQQQKRTEATVAMLAEQINTKLETLLIKVAVLEQRQGKGKPE